MKTRRVAVVSTLRTGVSGGSRTIRSGSFIALFALFACGGIAQVPYRGGQLSPPVHVTRQQHGNYGPVLPRTGTTTRSKLKPELQPPPAANTSTWTALGPAALNESVQAAGPFGGGYSSGRITGETVDPSNPLNIYIAAAGGGVWNTNDGGATWTSLTDNQATLSMGSIAIAPSAPKVIYAGTGEANNAADSNHGMGILASNDGGSTWTLNQGPGGVFNGLSVGKIVVDPTNALTAYAAMNDEGFNGGCYAIPSNCNGTGIYKTTDGGNTWA